MNNKPLKIVTGVLFNVATIAFGVSLLFSTLLENKQVEDLLSENFFGKGSTETIITGKPPIRYKTWYTSVDDVLNGNGDVAKAAQAEGTVLLKNENHALPLDTSKDKVSLFGVTAYDPMYSLDGAGEVKINENRQQFFKEEFEKEGIVINQDLAEWYQTNTQYWRFDNQNLYNNIGSAHNGENAKLNGASWDVLPASKTQDGFNTAIFVTGRLTNEATDIINVGGKGAKDGDYLKFTDNELSVLAGLKAAKESGTFKKIIVLFNQANPVSEDLPEVLKQYNVDAAIWMGFPGSNGIDAVADIIAGKTSPSGGLSTTWYSSRGANPTTAYYGNGGDVLFQENTYLGYKYAETRYEDYVLENEGAGDYIYGDNIAYPFGYGESYASFTKEIVGLKQNDNPSKNHFKNDLSEELKPVDQRRKAGDDYILSVKVTNTSDFAAKENVQVYVQKDYSANDKLNKVENPSVELAGFAKTKKLAKNESQILDIEIDVNKTFASYDQSKETYTIEAGEYFLSAARNSHEAINNILLAKAAKGVKVQANKMDDDYGAGNKNMARVLTIDEEYSNNYSYWTQGGQEVSKLFDLSDPNKASGDENKVTYMSRNDWTTTADNGKGQTFSHTGDMNKLATLNGGSGFNREKALQYFPNALERFKDEYPAYGQHRTTEEGKVIAEVQLHEMIGVEYDDRMGATEESKAKWEYFLDQLTWEETYHLVGSGLRRTVAIESIGKPYTNDVNASNAISWMFDMSKMGGQGASNVGFAYHYDKANRVQNPTGYPCEGIIAASFNKDVAYAVGQAIGEDGLWSGASGLYGFGLGLHRNPYHGRAGEYYSDDSYLAGVMGGYESKGAQSKGLYVYNKHFVLNDQETDRTGYQAWLNEQCFREVYLRPFELAIEIGDAMNVMTSFNKIGSTWSGNYYNLMTEWLRGEAGMRGFAVTDYFKSGGMNMTFGMLAGQDLPDGGGEGDIKNWGPENGTVGFYAQACRQAAKRILYTVANSNAMNFMGDDTKLIVHPAPWLETKDNIILSVNITWGVVAAAFVGVYGYVYTKTAIDEIKRRKTK